ncbi:unnamed protein product [Zymoseptoria tritici ST99CH_1E4]|uniref:Inhibitor of growth protein N-terminal histone-binding domain-containing protein n=1 Tax=Zymoseptoria tritici ST99CH_1E4 TaxID=1276532 RepID=A0A2H1GA89_ZYMTR|nr:unnamed protein product [Zymoseptoria tritici ST99CH_1E4]
MPSFFSICLLAGLIHTVASRHTHVNPHKAAHVHQHHARQAVVSVQTGDEMKAEVPAENITETAAREIIADLEDIKKASADLPDDLLEYIQAVDLRMASVESRLGALLTSATSIAALESEPSAAPSTARKPPAPFDMSESEGASPSQIALSQPAPTSPFDPNLLPQEARQSSPTIERESNAPSTVRRTSTYTATVTSYLPHPDESTDAAASPERPSDSTKIEQRPTGLAVTVKEAGATTFARVTSSRSL